jgi:hypothetical protein
MRRSLVVLAGVVLLASSCYFPDGYLMPLPQNTGYVHTGVTLTAYTGPFIITTDNTVIDSKLVEGCLDIRSANVHVTRSKIECNAADDASAGIETDEDRAGLVVADVEITSSNPGVVNLRRAVQLRAQGDLTRLYIHHTVSGVGFWGHSGSEVTDSFIGETFNACTPNCDANDPHGSGFGANGGVDNITLRHNNVAMLPNMNASSAISFYPETWAGGGGDGITIENNLLGGGSYCVYLGHTPPETPHTNMTFVGNWFNSELHEDCGVYGPVASWTTGGGNVWDDNYYATWDGQQNKVVTVGPEVQP